MHKQIKIDWHNSCQLKNQSILQLCIISFNVHGSIMDDLILYINDGIWFDAVKFIEVKFESVCIVFSKAPTWYQLSEK